MHDGRKKCKNVEEIEYGPEPLKALVLPLMNGNELKTWLIDTMIDRVWEYEDSHKSCDGNCIGADRPAL